jgi:hypothetical protein
MMSIEAASEPERSSSARFLVSVVSNWPVIWKFSPNSSWIVGHVETTVPVFSTRRMPSASSRSRAWSGA